MTTRMYTSVHQYCIVMSLRTVCRLNPLCMHARAQDPSGRMRAAVHRDVLEMEKGIDVGTALVLSDVTLFRGADAHDDAAGSTMIVTTRNVTSVFHFSIAVGLRRSTNWAAGGLFCRMKRNQNPIPMQRRSCPCRRHSNAQHRSRGEWRMLRIPMRRP